MARENTIHSLNIAAKNGADYVEFDVQLTKDKVSDHFYYARISSIEYVLSSFPQSFLGGISSFLGWKGLITQVITSFFLASYHAAFFLFLCFFSLFVPFVIER